MSLREELMIPFRGIGGMGRSISTGSVVLLRHGRGLAGKGLKRVPRPDKSASFGDKAELLVVVAFGTVGVVVLLAAVGGFVLRLMAPYAAWVATAVLAAWVIAAMAMAPQQVTSRSATSVAAKGGEVASPPPSGEVLAQFVRTTAAKRGQHGVHLDELLLHLPGVDRTALVTALREAGIPVKEQLKLRLDNGQQANRQGVRVEDLPAVAEKVESEHPGSVVTSGASRPLEKGRPAGA